MKRKADAVSATATEMMTTSTPKKAKKGKATKSLAHTAQQKNAISEFVSVTQSDKTTAAKLLKQANWNVGHAVNSYFNHPNAGANPHRSALSKIFDKYRDDVQHSPDEIGVEGTSTLLGELNIDLAGVGAFVFSELVQSPSLGNITRDGFIDGLSDAGVDSLPKIRNLVLQRQSQLPSDRALFKGVYNHTFQLGLQEKQKALAMDTAIELWRVVFTAPSFEWSTANTPWLDWWFEYYEGKVKKAVNKDLWKQTLNFAEQSKKDESLSFWNEESSWPSVIDEFVGWIKEEKRPGGGDAMELS